MMTVEVVLVFLYIVVIIYVVVIYNADFKMLIGTGGSCCGRELRVFIGIVAGVLTVLV